jgi:hypothetical protein
LCKWEGKERGRIAKKFSKIFFSPVSEGRRICTVPFKKAPCLFFIFFERKGNGFGSDPKMGYDSCPPPYNVYEAKLLNVLRSKLYKENKKGNGLIILDDLPPLKKIGLFSWVTYPSGKKKEWSHCNG